MVVFRKTLETTSPHPPPQTMNAERQAIEELVRWIPPYRISDGHPFADFPLTNGTSLEIDRISLPPNAVGWDGRLVLVLRRRMGRKKTLDPLVRDLLSQCRCAVLAIHGRPKSPDRIAQEQLAQIMPVHRGTGRHLFFKQMEKVREFSLSITRYVEHTDDQ